MHRLLRLVVRNIPLATGGAFCILYPKHLSTTGSTNTAIVELSSLDRGIATAIKLANENQQNSGNIKADFESLVKRGSMNYIHTIAYKYCGSYNGLPRCFILHRRAR
jgi:hypothetical protein